LATRSSSGKLGRMWVSGGLASITLDPSPGREVVGSNCRSKGRCPGSWSQGAVGEEGSVSPYSK
jgi:hypothetical protein